MHQIAAPHLLNDMDAAQSQPYKAAALCSIRGGHARVGHLLLEKQTSRLSAVTAATLCVLLVLWHYIIVCAPGRLLDTDDYPDWSGRFYVAIAAELVGVFLFAFFGAAAPAASAAWANGIGLAVLVFLTANVSGGHLNPAVTLATVITGDTSPVKGLMYAVAQVLGAVLASLLHVALIPGAADVGCFVAAGLTGAQVFGWETIMTALLVGVVYAVAVGEPSFGIMGPLAVGLSLLTAALTGGGFTGAALNPARVLGPAIVWGCNWSQAWIYIVAQFVGGAVAGLLSGPLYGWGPFVARGPGSDDYETVPAA